jgi:hypothetical protein
LAVKGITINTFTTMCEDVLTSLRKFVCYAHSHRNSYNAVCKFLEDNNLLSVIRAHEAQDHGYVPNSSMTHCGSDIGCIAKPKQINSRLL